MNYKKIIKSCIYPFVYTYCSFPLFNDKCKVSVQEAERVLMKNHLRIKADIYANNNISEEYDLMIIVPAYNVEKYLEECMESLINQETKYSYKIVVVNDGSTDRTAEILEKYVKNSKVEIIHQKNRGFSGARNRALENIVGKYIMFVDSDDIIYENSIQNLMRMAFEFDADIVEGGSSKFNDNNQILYFNTLSRSRNNKDFAENLRGEPWGKVIKSSIFKNLKFPNNYWYEDSIFGVIIYQMPLKKYSIEKLVYKYRQNNLGITSKSKTNVKSIDTVWIIIELLDCMKNYGISQSNLKTQISLINQAKTNQTRLRMLDEEIQRAGFSMLSNKYNDLFEKDMDKKLKGKNRLMSKIIRNREFNKFKLMCKF